MLEKIKDCEPGGQLRQQLETTSLATYCLWLGTQQLQNGDGEKSVASSSLEERIGALEEVVERLTRVRKQFW